MGNWLNIESNNYKIFCDESNHLLYDSSDLMVNGAILVPANKVQKYNKYIKYLRHKYNYHYELKWTKLFSKNFDFYRELIDFFFKSTMQFKATLVINKSKLNHKKYNSTHDDFYYKIYYFTLRHFIEKRGFSTFRIYLDYKDSRGGEKIKKLKFFLERKGIANNIEIFIINSKESQILQLCDLLIGAIGYYNRKDIKKESQIKNQIVTYLQMYGINLFATKKDMQKFNIHRWDINVYSK
jgi:hypothetical protein